MDDGPSDVPGGTWSDCYMALRDVNDRQRAILGWIADGCPKREWPDQTTNTRPVR